MNKAMTSATIQRAHPLDEPSGVRGGAGVANTFVGGTCTTVLGPTYGGKPVFDSIKKIVKEKQGRIVGEFSCKGFDTFGPFKLIGGISKGHPDKNDLDNAKTFFKELERRK